MAKRRDSDEHPPSFNPVDRERHDLSVSGLGTAFPAIHNHSLDQGIKVTFTVAMTQVQRSVVVPPRSVFPFHTHDGRLRADFIEWTEEHGA